MNKKLFQAACYLIAFGIILGAFAAHGLKDAFKIHSVQDAAYKLDVFEKGVKYHLFHAFALMVLAFWASGFDPKRLRLAVIFMLLGIVLFSGSLYFLSTVDLTGLTSIKPAIGPVTPAGGLCFIASWLMLAYGLRKP
ncbi:MAG TPA: DUF423 domain-containing protein [Flavobacteriales bacterium]|nr:DUF423 domain-containing protein [Flavobacteriales bacterium]